MIILDSMSHLYSTKDLQELYDFAVKKLKLKPEWNHYSRHFPHFDLTTHKKKSLAIEHGAIFIDAREDIEQVRLTRKVFAELYQEKWINQKIKYFYESKGLYGQAILRIDFKLLGIS